MRALNYLPLVLVAAGLAQAQVSSDVRSLFDSGLAASLLNADTVPASIISVKSATDFGGGFDYFATGSWVEIKGAGLSETTRIWGGADFSGGGLVAPTALDNVRVTVANQPAFVYYVSPTQLNVQVPADPNTLSGPVEVRVTNPSGGTIAATAQKRLSAPGMLAPAGFIVGGRQYMVAQFPDQSFVGRTGLISGVVFRPAKPGDTITSYGIGFGDVTPAIAPGSVVTAANSIVAPVTLSFGQTPATLTYKGLAPNFVGLYQFNIVVPDVPNGDYQINMTLAGQPLPQAAMYLTVER